MKSLKSNLLVGLLVASLSGVAAAATAENAHDMHSMHQSAQTAHEKEYVESMGDMHKDMMEGIKDADADRAFARSMIPHHAGAIKMAEIELKYGKDPEMRKLAEQIFKAQDPEIKQMKKRLEK